MVDDFLASAADHLNMDIIDFPLDDKLAQRNWTGTWTDPVYRAMVYANWHHSFDVQGRALKKAYRGAHEGRDPPMDPWVRDAWNYAEEHDDAAAYDSNMAKLREWGDWFNQEVLPAHETTCSDGMWARNGDARESSLADAQSGV